MTIMKRLFFLFFATMLAGQAWAQTTFEIDNLKYTVTDANKHEVSVGKGKNWSADNLVIPSEVKNGGVTYVVIIIGDKAFYECGELKSVTIPKTGMSNHDDDFSV